MSALDRLSRDFLDGYLSGFTAGVDRGFELAEQEMGDLQRRAAEVVHGMAILDPWPAQVARAQQAQRDAVARFRAACAAQRERGDAA
ncbi:hypothetical protein [Segeticoccus rhizosphaerae]|uniref:hypothetical protein n=1 Tax=Segeticoccus rhizosphaerae TaxID=1104777 RepID=UPI0010C14B23|nr:hypothetical protein [Ornithinicoccus soli]